MFRWIGNQILPQFVLLKSKEALPEAEIPPRVEMQNANHSNVKFYSEMLYKLDFNNYNRKVPI